MTWEELARRAVEAAGNDPRLVEGVPTSELGLRAARPLQSALASERGVRLPLFEDALSRYLEAREWDSDQRLAANGSRTVCGGGDACPGDGRCGVHR
jgi:hypothetical protein